MNDNKITICGVGITGSKYPVSINKKHLKEYKTWTDMIYRCFDENKKKRHPRYKDVTCCDKWLNYENFYEWLHSQENFEQWLNGERWNLDKDILIKGNKIYSSEACCLVPQSVNILFIKNNKQRGDLPIGVSRSNNKFKSEYHASNCHVYLGVYETVEDAFLKYKNAKESYIKQVARLEFDNGNITKRCYDAMMNYKVEIDD